MSNELTDTMELDSNTFGTDNSRETVFTGSIQPLLTIAEHQSDDDDDKENRRPGRDSETDCPLERDPTPMDHINNERSLGFEGTGKQDRQGNTADDRRPTPYPRESLEPMELSNDDDQYAGTVAPERTPLEDITPTGVTGTTGTFAALTTHAAICNRIDHICTYTSRSIHPGQRRRIANCWKLISDRRIAAAIVDRARKMFNWNCANLIDVFTNFAELQWVAPIIPAGSLDQFGFDLIQRILSADVERFYLDAISDIRKGEYGLTPNEGNPYRLIAIPFEFQHNLCVPDSCHALEQIDLARDTISRIEDLNKRIKGSIDSITKGIGWTTKTYPNGAKKQKFSDDNMKQIIETITELDLHQQILPRTPVAFRSNKIKGKGRALPPQHHTYQTWKATQPRPPTPPSPTPPSTSPPSTHTHGTRKSTRKSRTSSTTSLMSASLPPRPYPPRSPNHGTRTETGSSTASARKTRGLKPSSGSWTSGSRTTPTSSTRTATRQRQTHRNSRHNNKDGQEHDSFDYDDECC